jgi:shikimate kinase
MTMEKKMTSSQIQTEPATQTTSTADLTAILISPSLQRLVLTGFMGAGKSTVGRLMAARLGWDFLDLDAHLEQRTGMTIPEIFGLQGEARFRRLESSALASALTHRKTVIALGGGTPEGLTNRLLLEQTPGTLTVFLDAPFPTLFDRCVLQDITRPVLADPDQAELRFALRRPLYLRLAKLAIKTAALTPSETVDEVFLSLNTLIPRT